MAFEIKPREVTISGVTAEAARTYDGNAKAKSSPLAGVIDGLVDGRQGLHPVTGTGIVSSIENVGNGQDGYIL